MGSGLVFHAFELIRDLRVDAAGGVLAALRRVRLLLCELFDPGRPLRAGRDLRQEHLLEVAGLAGVAAAAEVRAALRVQVDAQH